MRDKVASSKGPILNGTRTMSVKLHDDKSCYTGIYARGGPKVRDNPRVIKLEGDLCDRSNSTFDGRKPAKDLRNDDSIPRINPTVQFLNMFEPRPLEASFRASPSPRSARPYPSTSAK